MAKPKDAKRVQVQIYLLKEQVISPEDAIPGSADPSSDKGLVTRRLPSPLEGFLLTKRSFAHRPPWARFIEDGMHESLDELSAASASALLILKVSGRCFALTFGFGRSLLEPSTIDRRFGLKVALNAMDPSQMRAVDSRTVEEMTLHTRRQASRTSEISSFGLDTSRDLLRGVTGVPSDPELGSRISGSESVTLSAPLTLADLPAKCSQLLDVYGRDDYKDRFAWIDHLQLVTDPVIETALQEQLSAALGLNQTERMHLAPPEALDWQNVSGFYYWEPEKSPRHEDLDIDEALNEWRTHTAKPLSTAYLRDRHIWVEFRENQPVARYTAYSALVYETETDGRLYVLSDGDWHEIDLDWANSVRRQVAEIKQADVPLPDAFAGEHEEHYNVRAATALHALPMDRCMVRYGAGRDRVEFCDILTSERQLVHVKRKTQSATLSHLFMQGQNSALLLAHDAGFRAAVHQAAEKAGLRVEGLVPLDHVSTGDYEVVFAIIASPSAGWPNSLPFFSQLSLSGAATTLRGMGYGVSLALVPLGTTQAQ